jgi:hypothetical protein
MKSLLRNLCFSSWVLLASVFPISFVSAQDENNLVQDSVRDLTTVLAIGAGGAVLGLSTLSFVDEPKDHLRNVLIGGAIGVIVGVGVVVYNQAENSRKEFEKQALIKENKPEGFTSVARTRWHFEEFGKYAAQNQLPQVQYSFSF